MKKRHIIADLMAVLGIVLAMGTVGIIIRAVHATPVVLLRPAGAVERARDMMNAACSGDYETASGMMYGTPNLGNRPADSSPAVDLIWEAFLESLDYTFSGDCYATDSGVAVDANIRYLDVPSAVEGLDSYAQALLSQRIATADDSTEIYDENNNFRQDLVAEILRDATRQVLEENKEYQEQTISLCLIFDQGEWWVMPNADLLNVLSGAISV